MGGRNSDLAVVVKAFSSERIVSRGVWQREKSS